MHQVAYHCLSDPPNRALAHRPEGTHRLASGRACCESVKPCGVSASGCLIYYQTSACVRAFERTRLSPRWLVGRRERLSLPAKELR